MIRIDMMDGNQENEQLGWSARSQDSMRSARSQESLGITPIMKGALPGSMLMGSSGRGERRRKRQERKDIAMGSQEPGSWPTPKESIGIKPKKKKGVPFAVRLEMTEVETPVADRKMNRETGQVVMAKETDKEDMGVGETLLPMKDTNELKGQERLLRDKKSEKMVPVEVETYYGPDVSSNYDTDMEMAGGL